MKVIREKKRGKGIEYEKTEKNFCCGHNNHDQSSSKPLEAIGQKIAEEITTAITNIANFIISLF